MFLIRSYKKGSYKKRVYQNWLIMAQLGWEQYVESSVLFLDIFDIVVSSESCHGI